MVILHIITSSRNWAGMEQYAFDLAKGLQARGDRSVFVVNNDGDVVHPRLEAAGKVYLCPLKSKFDPKSIRALRKIIRREQPDIIHTHQPKNIFQAWFAKEKKMPIIHTLHFVIGPSSPRGLYQWIFGRAARIVAVSALAKQRILELYPGLDADRIIPIFNSADPDRLQCAPAAEAETSGRPEHEVSVPVIVYAGRLTPEKGIEVLLEAARLLKRDGKRFLLKIAGTGNETYVNALKAKAESDGLADTVVFEGFLPRIGGFLDGIDIGVLPTIVPEACSITVLEFMSAGKAIVATDNGGPAEYLEHGIDGLLVPPSDPLRLRDALARLLDDAPLRETAGRNARTKFDNALSFGQFIERTRQVYLDCMPS